jgi:DNA (cytosine-5)-methyltransferase 1
MGFPNSFQIPVSDTHSYRQFGNSVVVPVIAVIARLMESALQGRLPTLQSGSQLGLAGVAS